MVYLGKGELISMYKGFDSNGFMKWLEPSGINSKALFNQLDNKSKNALMVWLM